MSAKTNKKVVTIIKVSFIIVVLAITLATATSMYRASRQYKQVKDCINKGGEPKACDIMVYGEPREMTGGITNSKGLF